MTRSREALTRIAAPSGSTDRGHRIESPLTVFVTTRPAIAELRRKSGGTCIAKSGRRGQADSPASSGPTRALDDRSVARSQGNEGCPREEDGQTIAAAEVARQEGACTCAAFARGGSVRGEAHIGNSVSARAAIHLASGRHPARRRRARRRRSGVPTSIAGAGRGRLWRSAGTTRRVCRRADYSADRRSASADCRSRRRVDRCHRASD